MKLLIISDMAHYFREGILVGHEPTVTEISQLSKIFDEITHIGCLHPISPYAMVAPYEFGKLHFVALTPTGGPRIIDKIRILLHLPHYVRVILRELTSADVVHIRCPANIPLVAIMLLPFVRSPKLRWIKYAGNWDRSASKALSYQFQRWWLKLGLHRGIVTVNGLWGDSSPIIRAFTNPCLTGVQLMHGRDAANSKHISSRLNIIFVGRVEDPKGIKQLLEVVQKLVESGISLHVDIVGDGPKRITYEKWVIDHSLSSVFMFHGWLNRKAIDNLYEQAHIILFPSHSEGWPKVLSEAMAFGVVPVASRVGSIPHYVEESGIGLTFEPHDITGFTQQIIYYVSNPMAWRLASNKCLKVAEQFSYETYLQAVKGLINDLKGKYNVKS